MAIEQNTFDEINGAQDEASLNRLMQFVNTGGQDDSNARAKAMIQQKMAERQAAAQEAAMRQKMVAQAQAYRANLPGLQEKMGSGVADQGRRGLAEQMSGIKTASNKRGLLYSGLRQGAQTGAQAQMAGNVAGQRAQINQDTESQAQKMEQAAAQSGLVARGQQIETADNAYNEALQKHSAGREQAQAIGSAAGQGAGMVAGAYGRNKPQPKVSEKV